MTVNMTKPRRVSGSTFDPPKTNATERDRLFGFLAVVFFTMLTLSSATGSFEPIGSFDSTIKFTAAVGINWLMIMSFFSAMISLGWTLIEYVNAFVLQMRQGHSLDSATNSQNNSDGSI